MMSFKIGFIIPIVERSRLIAKLADSFSHHFCIFGNRLISFPNFCCHSTSSILRLSILCKKFKLFKGKFVYFFSNDLFFFSYSARE